MFVDLFVGFYMCVVDFLFECVGCGFWLCVGGVVVIVGVGSGIGVVLNLGVWAFYWVVDVCYCIVIFLLGLCGCCDDLCVGGYCNCCG